MESKNKWYKWTYKTETHRLRTWTYGFGGKGQLRSRGRSCTQCRTHNGQPARAHCAQRALCSGHVAAWMGGGLGRRDSRICTAGSLSCSPETTRKLLLSYIPIQSLTFEKKLTNIKRNIGGHGNSLAAQAQSWLGTTIPQASSHDWKKNCWSCLQVQVRNYNLKRQKCHKHTHTLTSELWQSLAMLQLHLVLLRQAEAMLPLEQRWPLDPEGKHAGHQ